MKAILTLLLILVTTYSEAQIPDYLGEVICISGNCGNGKGRVRLTARDNIEIESEFKKRSQYGPAKVYSKAGHLIYEGYLEKFTPHGKGKKYELDINGKNVAIQEGRFENNILIEGITRNKTGQVLTNGVYDSTGRMIKGTTRAPNDTN